MMIFGILFGTYLYYRAKDVALFTTSQQVLNTTFGLINTLLLLFSSLLVVMAVTASGAAHHGPPRRSSPGPSPAVSRSQC